MPKPTKVALPNELLSYERIKKNWSQRDVAEKLNEKGEAVNENEISRWERGVTKPFPYRQNLLAELFETTTRHLGFTRAGEIPFWNVPYRRNTFFTGRGDILLELHSVVELRNQQYLSDDKKSGKKTGRITLQPQALVGLGAIGKSQIAREYAYGFAHEYQTVIWLNADSRGALEQDFAKLAAFLNLPEKKEEDLTVRREAVKAWLMHFTRWLLIFDGANELDGIRDFLPPECFGHIIITTQSSATGDLATPIKVDEMPSHESAIFLLRRSKELGLDNTGVSEEKYLSAMQIVKLAHGLPLMLAQASAFIERNPGSLALYPKLFWAQPGKHLHYRDTLEEYPYPVTKTFALNFKAVAAASPVAADLLRLFAFLNPRAIPAEMITDAALQLGPILSPLAENPEALRWAMMELTNYSLVEQSVEEDTFTIHPIIQLVIEDMMEEEEQQEWVLRAVAAVDQAFPFVESASETIPLLQDALCRWQRYLPHALMCALLIEQCDIVSEEAGRLLYKTASYFFLQGQFAQAELLFRQLTTVMERAGFGDQAVRWTKSLVATSCSLQERYDEAEQLCKEVLAALTTKPRTAVLSKLSFPLPEQEPGDNRHTISLASGEEIEHSRFAHLDTLDRLPAMTCLACLGEIYSEQERFAELEALLQQATDIMQGATDSEPPYYFALLFHMARLYMAQGINEKAEAAFKELITIRQGQPNSELVLASLGLGLAVSYVAQEKNYAEAEMHIQQALSVFLDTMPEHPVLEYLYEGLIYVYQKPGKVADLAAVLEDLADFHFFQGRYDKALPLFKKLVGDDQLRKEQPLIVGWSLLGAGLCYHLAVQNWPHLDATQILQYLDEAEELYIASRELFEELEKHAFQESPEDAQKALGAIREVQYALEELYQDRSYYSKTMQKFIDQPAANPDAPDEG